MNRKFFIALGVFWLVILGGFIASKEYTLNTGQEILLRTRPVDPRDLFRGDYVILSYDISQIELATLSSESQNFKEGETVYVGLANVGKYTTVSGVFSRPPTEGIFMAGKVINVSPGSIRVEYGIESYFVPQHQGKVIEQLRGTDVDVRAVVGANGTAIIKELLIKGEPVTFN